MATTQKNLVQLFIPISLETLCFMLTGMVDTMMISTQSDAAVGAVGTANTYIGMFIIMFNVISAGMIAVMTQYIGAGKLGIAYQARQIGAVFNATVGILLSLFLYHFSGYILEVVGVAPLLSSYAKTYLRIVGGACFLNALIPIFSSYLRAFGHTKQPLYATLIANILNLILNSVFLFLLKWGVAGVAISTVISRVVNLLIVVICSKLLVRANESPERLKVLDVLGQLIKIGLPAALETALYNVGMTITISFLNQMDPDGLNVTARSYTMQISNFSYCIGAALAQANAIMTGWYVGAKELDKCDKSTKKAAIIGVLVAAALESLFAIFSPYIMQLFTNDPVMITLVGKLLSIDIILEIGRVSNLVFVQALKTSGDAIYPTCVAIVFMFLCMVGGTYFFGIRLGLLAVGAYIGMASDECIRAIFMFGRWQSGKWKQKGLIRQ